MLNRCPLFQYIASPLPARKKIQFSKDPLNRKPVVGYVCEGAAWQVKNILDPEYPFQCKINTVVNTTVNTIYNYIVIIFIIILKMFTLHFNQSPI